MATVANTIHSKPRQPANKGVARRLRASGWIPAVAYGPSSETVHLSVEPKSFVAARQLYGASYIYDVEVEGGKGFKALIKQIDRDPVSRELLHIDLFAVDMTKPIKVDVKVILTGKSAGEALGGILQQIQREIEVSCLPANMPTAIEVDITNLEQGDTLHLSDLTWPEGVKATAATDEAVAIVSAPDVEELA